jgi:enoyl-[acyl-carrier-protein] reductase (NADH)
MSEEEKLEKAINEAVGETHRNEMLSMAVSRDNELKNMLVEYVGTKFEKEEVTVNMIAEALAHEFPEFVYACAEENFLRGYQLGLDDAYKTFEGKPEETTAQKL